MILKSNHYVQTLQTYIISDAVSGRKNNLYNDVTNPLRT